MPANNEVREFLMSRRALITPAQAGLPTYGERRVPGLRREEVAILAGVSSDYYTRIERGNLKGASDEVLGAIARALQLTDVEREHLFDLAKRSRISTSTPPRPDTSEVRASVQRVMDHMSVPAIATNAHCDIIAANAMGRAIYAPLFATADTPNTARFIFLDSRAPQYYADWAEARYVVAAILRLEAGRNPLNTELTALIGELSTRSPQFREDWARHDVHEHRTGVKTFHHPEVGALSVTYDVFSLPGEPGLQITTYSPSGSAESEAAFVQLADFATSHEAERLTMLPSD